MQKKTGILLLNLGTPDSPTTKDVRIYLREFLTDLRVIDMNKLANFLLVNFMIVPFRAPKSAEAYKLVWTDEGSPLLVHGRNLTKAVQQSLDQQSPGHYVVKLGMRYGKPSIQSVMQEFADEGIDKIRAFPLYPHFASATISSTMAKVYDCVSKVWNIPVLETVPVFYDNRDYIESMVTVAKETIADKSFDHYLFSYHGLPERHLSKSISSPDSRCLKNNNCCDNVTATNSQCYRAQCYATSRLLADGLGLDESKWSVAFQSRLGRDPWIKPYTDIVLTDLPKQGVKSLCIFSPAFVADCLETLEELNIRARADFLGAGGNEFMFIPSLNSHPKWVKTVCDMVTANDS